MDSYVCTICGYVYDPSEGDPDNGVDPGTKWEDVPEDWKYRMPSSPPTVARMTAKSKGCWK